MEAGRSATVQLQEVRAEARAATARAAEAEARLAAAQKQLHTVRGGASAAQTALQEEILSLKVHSLPLSQTPICCFAPHIFCMTYILTG